MARLTNDGLEAVKKKYNVSELFSFSRINTFWTSPYEYFAHYILHKKPDRDNSIYGALGSAAHQCLEDLYNGEIEYEDMIEQFGDSWITCFDIAQMKFDRNNEEQNQKISVKYKADLEHFFKNHQKMNGKVAIEKFVAAKIGAFVFQGYIDAVIKTDEGNYMIIDFKTSSLFGNKLEEKSCQLVVYSIALMQLGIPMSKIRPCFNMLKYCSVEICQKNHKKKTRVIERFKLGESLATNAKMWLKEAGYSEEEVGEYLKEMIYTNGFDCLPEEVRCKYTMEDHFIYVPLTKKLVDKWTNTIIATIRDIYARKLDYEKTGSDKAFFDTDEQLKEQSYYLATLCGYSPNLHLPYKKYLDKLEASKNGQDFFGDVGVNNSENVITTSKDICNNDDGDIDLSWLNDI